MTEQTAEMIASLQSLKKSNCPASIKMNSKTWAGVLKDCGASKPTHTYTHLIDIPVYMDESVPDGEYRTVDIAAAVNFAVKEEFK